MSVIYRVTVGCISVNCRWYIGELSVVYRSTVVRILVVLIYQVSPMAFFLSKDARHAMGEHVAVRGAVTL